MVRPAPEIADPERREFAAQIAAAMDARKDRIGEYAADSTLPWAVGALGPVPEDPAPGWPGSSGPPRSAPGGNYRATTTPPTRSAPNPPRPPRTSAPPGTSPGRPRPGRRARHPRSARRDEGAATTKGYSRSSGWRRVNQSVIK